MRLFLRFGLALLLFISIFTKPTFSCCCFCCLLSMACLAPGTLQKLLQNVGNKDFKAAGEHRSPLLQVLSIVPCLGDDPWKSRGFYIRVSDSLHSAYVSVSDEDVELILSDKVQIGQLIHVRWVDWGSPVPVLRGLSPIPKRRPCVGEPKDLISSDFLNATGKAKSTGKLKKAAAVTTGERRRLSFGNGKGKDKDNVNVEGRRLSLDSARKGWDSSSKSGVGKGVSRPKPMHDHDASISDSVVRKRVIAEDSPKGSPLTSKNVIMVSPKLLTKPLKSVKSSGHDNVLPLCLNKVLLNSGKGSDQKTFWNALPSTICDLGKQVRSHRNLAFASAANAVEEASVYEGVIQCMSMLAELCELSRKDSTGPLVEQFLNIHKNIKKASMLITSLICARDFNRRDSISSNCSSHCSDPGIGFTHKNVNASLWIRAAVETELSKFSLYTKGDGGNTNGEKGHYIVIENTQEKFDAENHSPGTTKTMNSRKPVSKVKEEMGNHPTRHLSSMMGSDAGHNSWSPGSGLKQAANLVEMLLSSSRAWFLDYLENSLNNGFGLSSNDGSQVAILLGHLKSVNQWLDDAIGEGGGVDVRIGRLKKKLYGFLLDHVANSTAPSHS